MNMIFFSNRINEVNKFVILWEMQWEGTVFWVTIQYFVNLNLLIDMYMQLMTILKNE